MTLGCIKLTKLILTGPQTPTLLAGGRGLAEDGTVSPLKITAWPRGQVRGWATQLAQSLCPREVRGQGSGSSFSRKAPSASG